jgi:hypothetical protein
LSDDEVTQRLAERVLQSLTAEIGVQVVDDITGVDDYLFRGPHGQLEHIRYSEELDQWKRGLYGRDSELRKRLAWSMRIGRYDEYIEWRHVHRDTLSEPEPVILERSEPMACSLCYEKFPSGNAFGWHLADVHEVDTDDKMQYTLDEVEEGQPTIGNWSGGSA